MEDAFGAACVGTQIQHGNRRIFEFLGPIHGGPLIVCIKIVELENWNPVDLPQVCMLVLREIFVIEFPRFSRERLGGSVDIMNSQFFIADVLFKLRLPVKYSFFQQYRIVNNLSLLRDGTLE